MKVVKNTLFVLLLLFILLTVTVIHADDTNNINFKTNNSTDDVEISNTYSDLQNKINNGDSNLNLTQNYKFDSEIDANLIDGVRISRSMNIVGKSDIYIDGANTARGLYIGSNCNVVLENLVFKNGYVTGNGGGVYLSSNSNLTLINCVFENNYAYNCDGAAVNANSETNLEIRNCEFINNTCVRESDLEWSQFKCGMGSGVCIDIGSTLKVYNSIFKQNIAHMATILVISYDDKNYKLSKLFMDNCSFESNCVKDCGIIYLDEMGQGEIHNSTFKKNNITHYGGILELDACLSALVKNCQFLENNGHIGAIHVKVFNDNYISNVSVQDCNFTKNKASVSGGGIYSNSGNVSVINCIFNQNSASEKAGAIYSKKSTMNIVNCYFNQNSASEKGGSIYSNTATMNIFNSNFNQNIAQDKGGGVCAFYSDLHVSQSNFNQNTAPDKGGAIYSNTGLISVDKSQFIRNSANCGGAVYDVDSSLSIISSKFNQNKAFNKGGALFSVADNFISYGCSYSLNSALNAPNIYGAFHVSIKQYAISSKSTAFKIKLSSPWKLKSKVPNQFLQNGVWQIQKEK